MAFHLKPVMKTALTACALAALAGCATLSPDGTRVLTGQEGEITLWQVR